MPATQSLGSRGFSAVARCVPRSVHSDPDRPAVGAKATFRVMVSLRSTPQPDDPERNWKESADTSAFRCDSRHRSICLSDTHDALQSLLALDHGPSLSPRCLSRASDKDGAPSGYCIATMLQLLPPQYSVTTGSRPDPEPRASDRLRKAAMNQGSYSPH